MLEYNEITPKKYILLDSEPYEVLSAQTSKKGRGQASNQVKLKNMISGKVVDRTFHQADTVKEADVEKKTIQFQYHHPKKQEYWFSEADNPKERFQLSPTVIGDALTFVKEQEKITAFVLDTDDEERIIGLEPPIKVDLEVAEAPPNVKGNTAQGGNKSVTVETGAEVITPMFIEAGDIIRVNTHTGEYAERVKKS